MREALGGTLLLYIVLFFLFVYISFMAVVINYGRVFRAKNTMISILEQQEGYTDLAEQRMLAVSSYNGEILLCKNDEYSDSKSTYYNLRLYIEFDFPLVDYDLKVNVDGQTSAIKVPADSKSNLKADLSNCKDGWTYLRRYR